MPWKNLNGEQTSVWLLFQTKMSMVEYKSQAIAHKNTNVKKKLQRRISTQ